MCEGVGDIRDEGRGRGVGEDVGGGGVCEDFSNLCVKGREEL